MSSKRGAVVFEACGSNHTLAFTMNNMVRYQDVAGETLLAACTLIEQDPGDMRRLRRLFWAGLGSDTLTQDQAGELMDDLGFEGCVELIAQAAQAAFPQAEEAAPGNEAAAPGNVKRSRKTR